MRDRWLGPLAVVVGGTVGGAARMGSSAVFAPAGGLAWGTLVANVSGSLLLGYLSARFAPATPRTTLSTRLLCTGALGSFTTFSTFAVETLRLAEQGHVGLAAAYAGGSVALGLAAAALGMRLGGART